MAFNAEGVATTNTEEAYHGMLMPLGGYKAAASGSWWSSLRRALGGAMSNEVGGIRFRGKLVRTSQMFLAIDVARFMPLEEFTARMESLVALVKSAPPAPVTTKCWWQATRNGAPKPNASATEFPFRKAIGKPC